MSPRILGYSYDATIVCPCCAMADFLDGRIDDTGTFPSRTDQHGLPESLTDRAGNTVRPVFSTDEFARDETCGACFERLES